MSTIAFRVSAVLWVIWGLVHVLAGVMTLSLPPSEAFAGIADAVDPALLALEYHPAVGAVLKQHGFNLGWIGLTTLVCVPYIWKGRAEAVFLAALVGGLADVGYFLFMDLGGHVHFLPGGLMTVVSGAAVVLSFGAWFKTRKAA